MDFECLMGRSLPYSELCISLDIYSQWQPLNMCIWWSGVAKVSCILRHRGIQLILAYSWARPAILVEGKGIGGMHSFFCFFAFIHVSLSSLSLSFISSTISSTSFLPFSGRRHKMTYKGWRVVKPQHNQSYLAVLCRYGSQSGFYLN